MDARKDVGGGNRGAKGIDGKKDVGFQLKGNSKEKNREYYGSGKDVADKTGKEAG